MFRFAIRVASQQVIKELFAKDSSDFARNRLKLSQAEGC